MDTKLKKSKRFSAAAKATSVAFILFFVVTFIAGAMGIVWSTDRFNYSYGAMSGEQYDSFTETRGFSNKFITLIDEAVDVNLLYKSEGNIREGRAVNKDEMLSNFNSYYGIVDGIITSSTIINDDYTVEIVKDDIPEEMMDNFYEYSNLISSKLRGYRSIYIQSQLDKYIYIKKDLDSYNNFYYYIENSKGSRVASNTEKNKITAFNQYIILDGEFLSDKMKAYTGYTSDVITNGNYKLYAGIPNEFLLGDSFYDDEKQFTVKKEAFPVFIITCIVSAFFAVTLSMYLMRIAGQQCSGDTVTLCSIDRIYNDIHLIGVIIFAILSCYILSFIYVGIFNQYETAWFYAWGGALMALAVSDTIIGLRFLCSISRQFKSGILLRNTLIATIFRKVGETLSGKSLTGWVMALFGLYTVICSALIKFGTNDSRFGLLLFIFVFIAALVVIKNMESLTSIMRAAKFASKGEYKNIDTHKITSTFLGFANDINNIQSGLKTSIAEAVKGERMKSDLITNVSHDLKTPLTSIISYAGLLDRENLNNDVAEGYVDVLVEKSQRLKQLIEDLIEASKASSGNLSVEKTKINLKELLMQACGEFEEKAQGANLEFRITAKNEVYIDADGKHMWRIYENLLSNVIKYAMPSSRIYIDIRKIGEYGYMTMKNISRNEIQVNVENLAERFVRGDYSRTTEGSGLGLSIAKSLVILQGGKFSIDVDGDMFKVTVEMPLWHEDALIEEIKEEK
ncbi:MAG TPA: sensor histidine kinase [Lachnospiraceae bacterium]|nr:sensor histidine kinase [Lachnospiraceae bacterium]